MKTMNAYNVKFVNKLRIDRIVEFILSAPSRNAATKRGEELLVQAGYRIVHFQRPVVTQRGVS